MVLAYDIKCVLVKVSSNINLMIEVYYIRMVVVYYMKCALVEAFTVIVLYDNVVILDENGGSILHEVCISQCH